MKGAKASLQRIGHGGLGFEGVAGARRVVVEHLHGLEGEIVQVFSDEVDLLEQVGGHGNDVAANFVGLENIQKFAGAGPDEFAVGLRGNDLERGFHDGNGIAASISHPSSKD